MQVLKVHHSHRFINGEQHSSNIQLECRDGSIIMIDGIRRFQHYCQNKQDDSYNHIWQIDDNPEAIYDYFKFMRQRRIEINYEIKEQMDSYGTFNILKLIPERESINQLWIDCRSVYLTRNKETKTLAQPKIPTKTRQTKQQIRDSRDSKESRESRLAKQMHRK